MRRFIFLSSIFLNVLLAGSLWYLVDHLGGFQYAWSRLRHDESALYRSRSSLFRQLPEQRGAVVMLGDSQIEQCEWQELLGDSLPVLNRGITGDHAASVLARVDDVLRNRPARVYLCVGVNDLLFGKTPEGIAPVYREIVAKIRSGAPDTRLTLISVLPINNTIKKIGIQNADIQALNVQIQEIARQYTLPYLDLYNQLTDAQGNLIGACTDDGLHLNGQGYLVWKKAMDKQR